MERYGGERGGRSHGFPGVWETAAPRPVGPGEVGRYRLSAELTGPGSQPTRLSVHLPAAPNTDQSDETQPLPQAFLNIHPVPDHFFLNSSQLF